MAQSRAVSGIALACALALLAWPAVRPPLAQDLAALPEVTVPVRDAPRLGSTDAPVVMLVFTDYQCPYCRAFAQRIMPRLEQDFVEDGRLAIVVLDLPLPSHDAAFPAAMAAACAGRQGAYWPMHRWLFTSHETLTAEAMRARIAETGLDTEAFEACLQDPAVPAAIEADMAFADMLGISATPSFVIGRELDGRIRGPVVRGLTPYSFYAEIIRRELEEEGSGAETAP